MSGNPSISRRWGALTVLALTVAVSFGSLFYAYSVLITDEAAGGRFSTSVLSTAYAGFVLFGGSVAFLVGRTADRHGVRPLVAVGSLLGGAGLVAISVAAEPWHVVAASWLLLGPAGAMTFYEPAFVAVDQWFDAKSRGPAISMLTVLGGLAGPIFLPLTGGLVESIGWRPTARALALVLVATGLVATLFLPSHAGGDAVGRSRPTLRSLAGERHFVLFTIAIVLSFGGLQAVFFHRIAVFEDAGFSVGLAAAWGGIASLLSFPGRFGAPLLRGRWGGLNLFSTLALILAGAVLIMVAAGETWHMVTHFVVFGLAFGGLLPLRAVVMGRWYSGAGFGSIMGAQWTLAAVAGAAGPWLVGVSRDAVGSYDGPMLFIAGAFAGAGVLTLMARRGTGVPTAEAQAD